MKTRTIVYLGLFSLVATCQDTGAIPATATPYIPGTKIAVPTGDHSAALATVQGQRLQAVPTLTPRPMPVYMPVDSADLALTRTVPIVRQTSGVITFAENGKDSYGVKKYKPISVEVLDVLDRGQILVQTKEQIRLRGARVPSERSPNTVDVIYAREANEWMRNNLIGKNVQLDFIDNPRDKFGLLQGTFKFGDDDATSDLLKTLLEFGYARLDVDDLWTSAPVNELREIQDRARSQHIGIWSEK